MPLLKGFSEIDEEGRLSIPSNIRREAGLNLASPVGIKVVRIKGSMRWPYLIVYHLQSMVPRLSQFEVTMMESQGRIDENGRLTLEGDVLEETKLGPHSRAEIKLSGPTRGSWLVIRNRGPNRLTTLQEKVGRQGKGSRAEKKWKSVSIEY
ncbi:MAG: hypothetical protein AB1393_02105 [Candidatus Edwardsbacteria bacterium]